MPFVIIYFYLMFCVAVMLYAGRLGRTAGWFLTAIFMSPVVAWAFLAAMGEPEEEMEEKKERFSDTVIDDPKNEEHQMPMSRHIVLNK
jgi:hypothetical protein